MLMESQRSDIIISASTSHDHCKAVNVCQICWLGHSGSPVRHTHRLDKNRATFEVPKALHRPPPRTRASRNVRPPSVGCTHSLFNAITRCWERRHAVFCESIPATTIVIQEDKSMIRMAMRKANRDRKLIRMQLRMRIGIKSRFIITHRTVRADREMGKSKEDLQVRKYRFGPRWKLLDDQSSRFTIDIAELKPISLN